MLSAVRRALGVVSLAFPLVFSAVASDLESSAAVSLTVQAEGVRKGEAGARYCNIQGKNNGKYASFGLITFPAPKTNEKPGQVEGLELTLVQSIPSFAKDGKVRFFLLDDDRAGPEDLKFDATSTAGLGERFKDRIPIGGGAFRKIETGHADTFTLSLDEPARKVLSKRLADKTEIRILIVPGDDEVAATYFGAGADEPERRPKITLKVGAQAQKPKSKATTAD